MRWRFQGATRRCGPRTGCGWRPPPWGSGWEGTILGAMAVTHPTIPTTISRLPHSGRPEVLPREHPFEAKKALMEAHQMGTIGRRRVRRGMKRLDAWGGEGREGTLGK